MASIGGHRTVKDVCEIGVVVLSTRNVPTDLIHHSDFLPMPKRRATSDEEDEVQDNAHQSASEGETVKKSKKSTAKSEKPKARATTLMRVTPLRGLPYLPPSSGTT